MAFITVGDRLLNMAKISEVVKETLLKSGDKVFRISFRKRDGEASKIMTFKSELERDLVFSQIKGALCSKTVSNSTEAGREIL